MKRTKRGITGAKLVEFWHKKGLYTILGLCILGSAVGSVIHLQSGIGQVKKENAEVISAQKKTSSAGPDQPAKQIISGAQKPSKPSESSAESSSLPSVSPDSGEESKPSDDAKPSERLLYILPAAGRLGNGFSGDELIYYPVLKLWQVHQGVDIEAEKGTPVKAAADGKVVKIFEDGVWGVAVRIAHPDGMISTVYGLNQRVRVKEGDALLVGDLLGEVAGVPAEMRVCGLHFTLQNPDGVYADPMDYLQTGEKKTRS